MEDSNILKKLDNDKLIDVVKIISDTAMMLKFAIMLLSYWKKEAGV